MFKKYLIFTTLLIAIFLNNTTPVSAACVDMLDYFKPNSDKAVLSSGGLTYVVEDGRVIGGKPTFYLAKSADGSVYEEFAYDDQFIYHGRDTSWATGPGQDVSCLDGRAAGFTMVDGSVGGCGSVDLQNYTPAKWVKRNMCEGETMSSNHTVVAFAKDGATCGCCEAPFTGSVSFKMRFNKIYSVYSNPNKPEMPQLNNVIEIEIVEGNGQGEKFLFNKEYGWVGFIRPGGETSIADALRPKPGSSIDYCPFVPNDGDGLSCESPLVLNADTSCATCSADGEVENGSSIWQTLLAGVTAPFTSKVKRMITLKDYKGAIPPIDSYASRQKGSAEESPLAYFTTHLNQNMESTYGGAPQTGGAGDVEVPPKIANIDRFLPPGKSTTDLQQEYIRCLETPTEVDIVIEGAPNLKHADMRVYCAQKIASTITNSFWSTPTNQISWIPPVGYTKEEAFGVEKTKQYNEYLAEAQTNYLAKNYSNEQKQEIVFNTIKQRQISNSIKYDPKYALINDPNSGKIQTAAVSQGFTVPACMFPVRTNVKTTCEELLGQREVKFERDIGTANCSKNADGTGGCGGKSTDIDIGVVVQGYGGSDITPGISIIGQETTCDANCALKQNSSGSSLANNDSIKLASTVGGYNGGYKSPGYTALTSTLYTAFTPPGVKALTEMAEEIPINVSAKSSGLFSGLGNLTSNSNQENSVAGFAKKCALPKLTSISLAPGTDEANNLENFLYQCEGEAGIATDSYCGSVNNSMSNSSKNFTITRGGVDLNVDPNNKYYFLDKSSDLKLSVANRYVDGATLILNHQVVVMNPGQTSASRCGNTLEESNGTFYQIMYLPRALPPEINVSSHADWLNYASVLEYKGTGYTNSVSTFNVKEGYYKIQVKHFPCLHDAQSYLPDSGVIKMFKENTDKNFCAKITNNSNMPGGGYASPITHERYNNDQTQTMGCTLADPYNVLANNSCGGLHGNNPEDNFWSRVTGIKLGDGDIVFNNKYTYSAEWLVKGKEMYTKMFGINFDGTGSCKTSFPTTLVEVKGEECLNLSNRDIGQVNPGVPVDPDISMSLDPPYSSPSNLPASGKAMYYSRGVMDTAMANQRKNYPGKIPDGLSMQNKGKYKGFVALLRAGDIGREVYITNPKTNQVEGPFLVVDVAAMHDIPSLLQRNWVVDVDYDTAVRWGMAGVGPAKVSVYESN